MKRGDARVTKRRDILRTRAPALRALEIIRTFLGIDK
jgi:hypothetical protein